MVGFRLHAFTFDPESFAFQVYPALSLYHSRSYLIINRVGSNPVVPRLGLYGAVSRKAPLGKIIQTLCQPEA